MASDDGENTSFPCLATVRSLLAAVVTVLAVVVVIMVIVVVHRPEDISLSIGGGYVQTDQVWWKEFLGTTFQAGTVRTGSGHIPRSTHPTTSTGTGPDQTTVDTRPHPGTSTGSGQGQAAPAREKKTVSAAETDVDDERGVADDPQIDHGHVARGKMSVSARWHERATVSKSTQVDQARLNAGVLLSNIGHAADTGDDDPETTVIGHDPSIVDPDVGYDGRAAPEQKLLKTGSTRPRYDYEPTTDPVNLQVTLKFYNPSGRGRVSCNVTDIRVLDLPAGASSTGRKLVSIYSAKNPLRFFVPPQASHTEQQLLTIRDNDTLQFLFDNYKGMNSFRTMVRVSTTTTSKAQLSWATGKNVDHCCGPVDVVYGTPDDKAYGTVTCNMQSSATPFSCESSTTLDSQPPAPAPAKTG